MIDYKSSRTLSQLALKDKWIETKGNSCIEAATGYGKSLIAVFIIQEMNKRNEHKQTLEDNKADIGWGNQIRSYVLDQARIKDLRTKVETTNTQAVLNGDLDLFIEASLKSGL